MFQIRITLLLAVAAALGFCSQANRQPIVSKKGKIMNINIASATFKNESMIPSKYNCDGEDISPPLSWDSVPPDTKSITLISDDQDAPGGTWVHWVIYNIPVESRTLAENVPKIDSLQNGARQGISSFRSIGYGGP
jgi:Raf kinase inhibitor-like YbhB/YbcL family protein